MTTAELIQAALPNYCPTTNFYRCDNGKHLLVTVMTWQGAVALGEVQGVPISISHAPQGVAVFLADDAGRVIDYDGEPANGLTPIASTNPRSFAGTVLDPSVTTHEAALNALGYTLTEQEP